MLNILKGGLRSLGTSVVLRSIIFMSYRQARVRSRILLPSRHVSAAAYLYFTSWPVSGLAWQQPLSAQGFSSVLELGDHMPPLVWEQPWPFEHPPLVLPLALGSQSCAANKMLLFVDPKTD